MKKYYHLPKPILTSLKVFTFLLLGFSLHAQIEISGGDQNPWTPQNLIENVFLGEGVEVTNINYTGTDGAVGYFQNGLTDVGLERGIIMTSGFAVDGLGPDDSGGSGQDNNSSATCPELDQITTSPLFNVAAYEITFIPVNDTLRFRYVFASEEYPEFACSGFNDVFGFFISGPNPSGGTYANENIALIPDPTDPTGLTFTTNPVTINNVNGNGLNPGSGCNFDYGEYYNTNNGDNLQYDGYLDAFTAQAVVIPCEEYTIKLAVADAGDSAYDTAVFLEAKSFGTGKLEVTASTVRLDGTMVEGCANGQLCFEIPGVAEADIPIDYNFIGSAINGVDFENIPLDLFIPEGDSIICQEIIPIVDGIAEGLDSLGIDVQIDPCTRDTFWIYIQDPQINPPDLPADMTICNGDSVLIDYDVTLGIDLPDPPNFSYSGAPLPIEPVNTGIFADIDVSGVFPLTFQEGVLKSVCIDSLTHKWDDDLDIFLFAPGGQFIELSTDNGANGDNYISTCFTPTATDTINEGPGGFAPASAAPFTGEFQPEGRFDDLYGSPTNGTWQLFVLDDAAGFSGDLWSWSICFEPLYQLSYSWSPAEGLSCADCATPIASPDTTTTYVLTVTDTYGCSSQDSITITVDDILPAPDVLCGSISPNSITFTWNDVSGATGGYQVNVDGQGWIPANGTLEHIVTGLSLNQTVTLEVQAIADCNGAIGTVTCMTPDCPAPTGSVTNIVDNTCFGDAQGQATVVGSGANPPFTYSMNGTIDPDGIFTSLAAGTYTVQVVDNVNCGIAVSFTIGQPDSLASTAVVVDDISCNGLADGEGTVTLNGGTGPYAFTWSTGSADSIATNLVLGENYVTVTDGNGCTVIDTISVTEPDLLTASISADTINCFGGTDGNAIATAAGGSGSYTYAWSDGQDDMVANGLSIGTYTVTISDTGGCTATESITLVENTPLDLTDTTSTLASCNGVQNGTATVIPTGGAGGYLYAWQVIGNQTTQTAVGLTVGTYTVEVTDQLGCTATTTVTVGSPDPIMASFDATPALCFDSADGQVTVTVSGGTPDPTLPEGYTFDWSVAGGNGSMHSTLPAGTHFVTITDVNFCSEILEVEVTAPTEMLIDLTSTPLDCASSNNGTASVQVTGGAGGYGYNWDPMPIQNPNLPTIDNLGAGWVYVTVTDQNGCTKVDSTELMNPNALELDIDFQAVNCFGENNGTATVTASSGAGNYTYLWDAQANNQTTATATSLTAATYFVTVTDQNGCADVISVEVTEPMALTTTTTSDDALCFGQASGNGEVTVSGGVGNYTYTWSDPSNQTSAAAADLLAQTTPYYVTVSDGNGCTAVDSILIDEPIEIQLNMSAPDLICFGATDGIATVTAVGGTPPFDYAWNDPNNQTTPIASNLPAGTYTVTVTDQGGCTFTEEALIESLEEVTVVLSQEGSFCHDGNDGTATIEQILLGNTPAALTDFSYSWSVGQTSLTATNIQGGTTVEVTVQNSLGCLGTAAIQVDNPAEIGVNIVESTDVVCNGGNDGTATAEGLGGVAPYTYQWSANANSQTTAIATDLAQGSYGVTVSDANGCTTATLVNIAEPSPLAIDDFIARDVDCYGENTGTLNLTITGGDAPYLFTWSNGANTPTLEEIPAGTYSITVTDINGCSVVGTQEVRQPAEPLTADIDTENVSCFGGFDGAIYFFPSGGTQPYTYSLDGINFNGSPVQIGLYAGDYNEVWIQDVRGCRVALPPVTIVEPPAPEVNLGPDTTIIFGNPVYLNPTITNAVGVITYDWTPKNDGYLVCDDCQPPVLVDSLDSQTSYELTITDERGCTASDFITIFVRKLREVAVPSAFSPNGDSNNDLLLVHGREGSTVSLFRVYDRWGELVFETGGFAVNNPLVGWDGTYDGKELNPGVYIWYLEVEFEDGATEVLKGHTTLIK
ncbi:MAG: choice-of-anchor L domain-containing protein [Bacteroidota bacterium]